MAALEAATQAAPNVKIIMDGRVKLGHGELL
jgi:hypothetical protein